MDLLLGRPPRIQPYFGYRTGDSLHISARALRSGMPRFVQGGRIRTFRTMLAQFASREVGGLEVVLELEGPDGTRRRHSKETDREGFVHFGVPIDRALPPDRPVWEAVTLHWGGREDPRSVQGLVLAPGETSRLGIISDIDDTIIETGITGGFRSIARNWRRVLAQLPDERLAAPGVDAFYAALGGRASSPGENPQSGDHHPTVAARPFFYISSSPWNLFSYLVAFKQGRSLPLGPLFLRDWGLNRETLGSASHGAHKRTSIDTILAAYPGMRFILVGDDTQGDLPAYADVVRHHPERVEAVFIRTLGEPLSLEEQAAKAAIEAANVPLWIGRSYDSGREFLYATGLGRDKDGAQIVEERDDGEE